MNITFSKLLQLQLPCDKAWVSFRMPPWIGVAGLGSELFVVVLLLGRFYAHDGRHLRNRSSLKLTLINLVKWCVLGFVVSLNDSMNLFLRTIEWLPLDERKYIIIIATLKRVHQLSYHKNFRTFILCWKYLRYRYLLTVIDVIFSGIFRRLHWIIPSEHIRPRPHRTNNWLVSRRFTCRAFSLHHSSVVVIIHLKAVHFLF